ncbi:NAD(P)-binding protein, partial [Trichodelitschia bisporula]
MNLQPPLPPDTHILLTGATGFVGTHITRALLRDFPNIKLTLLDLERPEGWTPAGADISLLTADITSPEAVSAAFHAAAPITAVIHTAGFVPVRSARYTQSAQSQAWSVNVEGTANVLTAARECRVRAVVATSSCTVVTDAVGRDWFNYAEDVNVEGPRLVYGETKAAAEELLLAANTPDFATCALRPSTLCGEGDYNLIPTILSCIPRETPFTLGSGLNLYDFTYAGNVADAHVLALHNLLTTRTAAGLAIAITNGEPVPFRAFCLAVWREVGHYPLFEVMVPRAVGWFAGCVAEGVGWLAGKEGAVSRGSVG